MSYVTLRNFLDSIAATALPTQIDGSLLASKSGSSKKLLRATLRYLGLTTAKDAPTPDMQRLVSSKGQERQQVWRIILKKSYSEVFESGIDLSRTTTKELSDIFRSEGVVSQDTVRKCVTFFSLAAKDAGIHLSPHVKPYSGTRVSHTDGPNVRISDSETSFSLPSSALFRELLGKFPAFDPSWPEEERKSWIQAFKELAELGAIGVDQKSFEKVLKKS